MTGGMYQELFALVLQFQGDKLVADADLVGWLRDMADEIEAN
jgi:hypothetical protein